jgi:arginyl-tRNA synthetase
MGGWLERYYDDINQLVFVLKKERRKKKKRLALQSKSEKGMSSHMRLLSITVPPASSLKA